MCQSQQKKDVDAFRIFDFQLHEADFKRLEKSLLINLWIRRELHAWSTFSRLMQLLEDFLQAHIHKHASDNADGKRMSSEPLQ